MNTVKTKEPKTIVPKTNTTDKTILSIIRNENKELKEENSNKNTMLASTQRDYIAGEVSRDLTQRILLPKKIVDAHKEGILHFHDMDYFIQPIHNCCLVNIKDMLENGTVMNGKLIEEPKSFRVACIIMTQIIAVVASNQYGGQSLDMSHLGKYLRKSHDKLKEKYPNAIVAGISPNLASMESVRKAFKEATEKYGCVDILVNNAGISENTSFMDYTEETFDKVMDLNVKGVFNTTRVAAECMVARGKGVILSTSSMVSISGQPSGFAYPASKFAVNGLTVSLARELGPKGIRVNAVAPGITETDMMKAVPKEVIEPMIERIPLRRLGQPEDIANAFVFLASDEASYITGVILSVDGMARS